VWYNRVPLKTYWKISVYVTRQRVRNEKGQLTEVEYTILELPSPKRENPVLDNPVLGKPEQGCPEQENPAQLNTNIPSTYVSNPIQSNPYEAQDRIGTDGREEYREIILENIEYDIILYDRPNDNDRLDEIVELVVDTVCSARKTIRVAGDDYPAEVVKSRLMKLDSEHIRYVLDCMAENTTYVRNVKKYLLAALYNAPLTIGNYYTSLVSHDLYGGGDRG
jgi:hypothetical protein